MSKVGILLLNVLCDTTDPSTSTVQPLGYAQSPATASLGSHQDLQLLPQGNDAALGLKSIWQHPPSSSAELSTPPRAARTSDHRREMPVYWPKHSDENSYPNPVWILSADKFLLNYLLDCAIKFPLSQNIIKTDILFISLTAPVV